MASSKIHICNVALAALGAESIRSFDENNKRARMCDVFYESMKEYMLGRFDWPFARGYKKLQPLDQDSIDVPPGMTAWAVPSDCAVVRDLMPPGSADRWSVSGNILYCQKGVSDNVYITYTRLDADVGMFSGTFALALSYGIASRICAVITQDKKLGATLETQFQTELYNAMEVGANEGNDYRAYDDDPNNDTFVNPPGSVSSIYE